MCAHLSLPSHQEVNSFIDKYWIKPKHIVGSVVLEKPFDRYYSVYGHKHPAVPILCNDKRNLITTARWGLWYHKVKRKINALGAERSNIIMSPSESLKTRVNDNSLINQRGIVLCNGIIVQKAIRSNTHRIPLYIYSDGLLALACVWNTTKINHPFADDECFIKSISVLADIRLSKYGISEPFPFIIASNQVEAWLSEKNIGVSGLSEFMSNRVNETSLKCHTISAQYRQRKIDNSKNIEVLTPVTYANFPTYSLFSNPVMHY